MKFGKVLLAGIVVGIINPIWGFITCGKLFNWVYLLEPTFVWKLPEQISYTVFSISGIIFAILLALVYALLYKGIPGGNLIKKGLWFGLCVWLVGCLPGCTSFLFFSVIAPTVIYYWIISGLVVALWQGVVIAVIYK
ncbi:MAG: hypothetical protein JSV30_04030 [Candidatus Omnitrophota bacterium]|nr:MAG: hypothetical protein JSV30_04030 [Candidatus Omnitrophota bacterium]